MPTTTPQFEVVDQLVAFMATYGLSVLGGFVILVIGFWIAGRAERLVDRALGGVAVMDQTLRRFTARMVRYLILVFTGLSVLGRFGIETTSLIAVFGAAGLAIGLALQGTLSHLAAGVMLLFFRPFRVGDQITAAGHSGTVREIDLFVTELATGDNSQVLIPNGAIWGNAIVNESVHPRRRIDLEVPIATDIDLDGAAQAVRAVLADEPRCLTSPAPAVDAIGQPARESMLSVRVWCVTQGYAPLRADLVARIRAAMPRFPKRVTS
jgi:small conductance mechanosensitive channel